MMSCFILDWRIGNQRIICRSVHAWVGGCRKMSGGSLEVFTHCTTTHRLHCLKMVSKRLTLFKVDWSGEMGRNCEKIPIRADRWKCERKFCSDRIDFTSVALASSSGGIRKPLRFRPRNMKLDQGSLFVLNLLKWVLSIRFKTWRGSSKTFSFFLSTNHNGPPGFSPSMTN